VKLGNLSTRMGDPFIDISDTRSAEDELARWQSGQESCAAAKSTGGGGRLGPAMVAGTGDPEGALPRSTCDPGPLIGATRPPGGDAS
jgi:hypothetical protein